jgi:hypothetical protein
MDIRSGEQPVRGQEELESTSTLYFLTISIVEGSRASVSFATFGLS